MRLLLTADSECSRCGGTGRLQQLAVCTCVRPATPHELAEILAASCPAGSLAHEYERDGPILIVDEAGEPVGTIGGGDR
jgi:hypothetical protein